MEGPVNPDPGFWAGRSVLITGHTGFKGSWLTLWLSRLGAKVHGFALQPDTDPSLFHLAADRHAVTRLGDVRDLDALRACLDESRPEIVFHMAAQSLVRASYDDPVGTYATNVMGTVNLLEAVRRTDSVTAVIVVTSDKCYENREWLYAYRETDPMGGHDPYSSSKGCAELVTAAYRSAFFPAQARCRVASARAGNVVGGGDWSADRLVPDIVRAFGAGRAVPIRNPHAVRPWQYVLEPLCGYIRLAEQLASSDGAAYAEGWNFGPADEDCRAVAYIVARLAAGWGGDATWTASPGPHPHEASFLKVDASKARARLGWERRLRLDDTLDWTMAWYRARLDGRDATRLCLEQIERYESLGA
ncbi:MAG: CDP-glucose 4,6-dehydratase [Alphaproteobacteria bacterium]|nr:CDP-glucose 4,6-dehydratase [Alphaproteobacteria bacterium]